MGNGNINLTHSKKSSIWIFAGCRTPLAGFSLKGETPVVYVIERPSWFKAIVWLKLRENHIKFMHETQTSKEPVEWCAFDNHLKNKSASDVVCGERFFCFENSHRPQWKMNTRPSLISFLISPNAERAKKRQCTRPRRFFYFNSTK